MIYSNVIGIIVTTGATLHAHGITQINTAEQAAEALRPLAGPLAFFLFAAGIVGTGLLAVPVLAGSAGYAVAETFGWRGSRSSGSSSDRGKGGVFLAIVIAAVMIAVAWLLSIVIRFALSRSREYLADAGSVELTKNPDAMITALRKIEGRGELEGATSTVMEMCVDNPREGFVDLFATHPSIDKRIEAIIKFGGGRDPGPIAIPD